MKNIADNGYSTLGRGFIYSYLHGSATYASIRPRPAAAAMPEAPAPTRNGLPARPRPHRPQHRVPAPGLQDAGLPQPRGRPVPHPPDPLAGSGAARPLDCAFAARSTKTWWKPSRWRTTWATRPSAMPGRMRSTTACAGPHGGFEHNLQSLRVVDTSGGALPGLRRPEPELRDARGHPQALLARRQRRKLEAVDPGGVARRFLDRTQPSWKPSCATSPTRSPTTRTTSTTACAPGLITLEQLDEVELFDVAPPPRCCASTRPCRGRRVLYEAIRRMLSAQVYDVIDTTLGAGLAAALP
jgi:hypothetical protein